jgi:DNA-directed RNA polymerase specialized sigma24 family protein
MTDTSQELLSRYREGSEDAATAIFNRYVQRLTSLARIRMSERLARRIDADDVVLSAYRSFFLAARDGRFTIGAAGDLWKLLVSITIHKLHRQALAHQTLKRSMAAETGTDCLDLIDSREPTTEEVLIACEELEAVLKALPPLGRRVLELRLQGDSLTSIADETSRTERTVRRMLELARGEFRRRAAILDDRDSP